MPWRSVCCLARRNRLPVPGSVTAAKVIAGIQMVLLVGVILLYVVAIGASA